MGSGSDFVRKRAAEAARLAYSKVLVQNTGSFNNWFIGSVSVDRATILHPDGTTYSLIFTGQIQQTTLACIVGPNLAYAPGPAFRKVPILGSNSRIYLLISGSPYRIFCSADSNLYSINTSTAITGLPVNGNGSLCGFSNDGQHFFLCSTSGVNFTGSGSFTIYWCIYENYTLNANTLQVESTNIVKGSYVVSGASLSVVTASPVEANPYSYNNGTGVKTLVAQGTTYSTNFSINLAHDRTTFPGHFTSFNLTTDLDGVLHLDFAIGLVAGNTAATSFEYYFNGAPTGSYFTGGASNSVSTNYRLAVTSINNAPSLSISSADYEDIDTFLWPGPDGPSFDTPGGITTSVGVQGYFAGQPFRSSSNQLAAAWEGDSDGIQYWDASGITGGLSPGPDATNLVTITDQYLFVVSDNPFNTTSVRATDSAAFLSINKTVGSQNITPYSKSGSGFIAGAAVDFNFPLVGDYGVSDWIIIT